MVNSLQDTIYFTMAPKYNCNYLKRTTTSCCSNYKLCDYYYYFRKLYWYVHLSGFICLHVTQVVEGGEEVASRMIAVIGILGVGGAAMVVTATGTGTMIGVLVGGQKVCLVAVRSRMVLAVVVMVVTLVVVMETTITAAVMDRDILGLQQIRWVPSEIRASRGPHSLGACRGLLKME